MHRLTEAWARELEDCPRDLAAQLQAVSAPDQATLDGWLDDTRPLDVVWRLERTLWSLHSHVLRLFLNHPSDLARERAASVLPAVAESQGTVEAETDWGKYSPGRPAGSNPVSWARMDLRRLILTLSGTPFAGTFLVVRATASEARIELLQCAHLSPYPEVQSLSDPLCLMHASWVQGFARGLNPRIRVEHQRPGGRCQLRWTLHLENVSPA